jgi:hypothetical protein
MERSLARHDNKPSTIDGPLRRLPQEQTLTSISPQWAVDLLTGAGGEFGPAAKIVNEELDLWFIPEVWAGEERIPIASEFSGFGQAKIVKQFQRIGLLLGMVSSASSLQR